jgi:hypothetical protein
MRLLRFCIAALAGGVLVVAAPVSVRADTNSEMVVKAVMIRKFAEFVTWPDAISPQNDKHVKVCVYGDSSMSQMGAVFSKTSASSTIRYSLATVSQLPEAGVCHVVFLGAGKQDQFAALKSKSILIVGDSSGFVERGGMIGFEIVDGKVRYNINNKAFGAAGLKVDAQLLEIANKVVE